jgi:acylphosphatase
MAMHAANIRITGKVQGVFFRDSARQKALDLELTGFIRNEPDGTVYAEVEGEEEAIEKFVKWCKEGPEHARVKSVDVKRQPLKDLDGFRIGG